MVSFGSDGTTRRTSGTRWSTETSTLPTHGSCCLRTSNGSFAAVADEVGDVMQRLGQGPNVFGLIHADAHLDNVLFDGQEARLIDFDDCGFGYRIYDVAVALWELRHRDDYPTFNEAFVRGYTEHRQLPAEQLKHLDAFIAAREVAFGLWLVGMAETRPAFRKELEAEFGYIERSLRIVLNPARP